jgi:HD-like signal output (HDOD) protein
MVVVARWQLPEPIAEVITSHHAPHTCNRVYRPLVQLVAIDRLRDVNLRLTGGRAPHDVEQLAGAMSTLEAMNLELIDAATD